ncbi:MAG: hypothetical protein OJF51_003584 [Nitrospira sp.]|nr:MAG: hypothetical protein OJF51_003584 [Nitrospira sp.]
MITSGSSCFAGLALPIPLLEKIDIARLCGLREISSIRWE